MSAFKFIYYIFWLALSIGVGEALISFTNEMRGAAVRANQRGPLVTSYSPNN